ncbi:hypothetical protein [Klebsiella oxytoca]|uniref:hypothetical protein n=1 Tax=Klebsiella oxytoca TaxID=571 RepID=UPI00187D0FCE|nr:hypothetical protein [Klebsiella oxytoca]MCW9534356.1 hypothetical protein [Klebsiella oxytoca]QSS41770.1 hypothetical protein ISU85_09655 [Klebsiella oxytoca]HED3230788.1 hypothetical protein [Klebsiella oxytoca]HED3471959.1 hypothetical protein [Klebsiella oxytoca]HEH1529748.1 hypothetical protein [Klebsiella oxytoca]
MNIYHYTDLNGLKGILSSNAFWATNFYFMNDAHELQHGVKCIENALGYLGGDLSEMRIDFIKESLKNTILGTSLVTIIFLFAKIQTC